jgi:hypothetical protein
VAVGTGGRRYAQAFIEDESVPFRVLLDEDGRAADVVQTRTLGVASALRPDAVAAGLKSFAKGHRQRRAGRRPTQLGATFVIGPGDKILYEDFERFAGDHAEIDDVVAALST